MSEPESQVVCSGTVQGRARKVEHQVMRRTADWQAADRLHHLHPFTDHASMHRTGSRIFTRGVGCFLYDSQGNRFLDAMSGLWCVTLGYSRQELIDAAVRQLSELAYASSFFQSTHPAAIDLSQRLSAVCPQSDARFFFTNSGSEANDTVVRLVRRYWEALDRPARKIVISRLNAYHGSTLAAASLGGFPGMHAQGGLPLADFMHIREPDYQRYGHGMTPHEFGLDAARDLERCILAVGSERVAAFIGEPIQGAGGVIVPPRSYWPEIRRIADRYGILLILDEVICGFGRTGSWFGSQHFSVSPDLMTMAKGLSSGYQPIGAVMVSSPVAQVVFDRAEEFEHGFTCSGHPVACAVASETIGIMLRESIVERVGGNLAPHLRSEWSALASHPLVAQARCCGLMAAVELRTSGRAEHDRRRPGLLAVQCREACMRRGVIVRAECNTLIVAPPLIVECSQLDQIVEVIHTSLDDVLRALPRA